MNKETFLKQLERELRHIPEEDRQDAISYYREYFEEMGADDTMDVSRELGSPHKLAQTIISEVADKHVGMQSSEGGIKSGVITVWMVVLAIFAAPIALPLAMVGVVMLVVFVLVGFIVSFSVFIAAVSAVLAAVYMIPAIFVSGGLAQSAVCLGLALAGAGLAIFLFYGAKWLYHICVLGVTTGYQKMFAGKRGRLND